MTCLMRPFLMVLTAAMLNTPVAARQPLRILLITGGGYHDYEAQKAILTNGLGQRLNAEFTIDHSAGKDNAHRVERHNDPNWLRGYDLVIYNICFADVRDNAWSEAIVRAHVRYKVPAVALHCTMHSYNYRGDSPIWSQFLGVRTQRHQRAMGHDVENVATSHAIMRGLPAKWTMPQGELYEILEVYASAQPLTQSFGEESKKNQVTAWTNEFEGVRVFGTTLGHHNETMQSTEFLDLVANGVRWATNTVGTEQNVKKVVFVAGPRSHGYGAHEHNAGSLLLARLLRENYKGINPVVYQNGWPSDRNAFDGAAAIVIYANGGPSHPALQHMSELRQMMDRGVGLVLLHYAVEVPRDTAGAQFLDWAGGYFEAHWSVNPIWLMQNPTFGRHPIANGLKPYDIEDEFYYHMRFREGMRGVTPILTALPPASSLSRPDGTHSGNPNVRAAVLERREQQHLSWAAERANGGRAFGFTGSHFHWNWGHPMQRRMALNAIVWAAKAEVPRDGVPAGVVTMEDLEANQDYPVPANFDRAKWKALVDHWQRAFK